MDTPPPETYYEGGRMVLSEIMIIGDEEENFRTSVNIPVSFLTPAASPDEQVIQKRGPRNKPITWSPVDSGKVTKLKQRRQNESPQKSPPNELRRSLRRRLILSPGKNPARNLAFDLNKIDKFNTTI